MNHLKIKYQSQSAMAFLYERTSNLLKSDLFHFLLCQLDLLWPLVKKNHA